MGWLEAKFYDYPSVKLSVSNIWSMFVLLHSFTGSDECLLLYGDSEVG